MEYKVLELTEEDKQYLEMQVEMRSKICGVFGISQKDLGIDPSLPPPQYSNLNTLMHIPRLEEFMQEWAE